MRALTVASVLVLAGLAALFSAVPAESDYQKLKADAEALFREGSFGLAHELYRKADALELPVEEARWVDFRVADTLWRAEAQSESGDSSKEDAAREQLLVLAKTLESETPRVRLFAEVHESLGDFFWMRRGSRDWGSAWPHYQQALDWWSGSSDLELARGRYLGIVWRMSEPRSVNDYESYGDYGNILPLNVVENALEIAKTEEDRARAHYLIAMTLRSQGGDPDSLQRVSEEFESAIRIGRKTHWYDDALFQYAQWVSSHGRMIVVDGQPRQEPDFVKALELYRRILSEFAKGQTRFWDQAMASAEAIVKTTVQVSVSNIFLPDSEIDYALIWRNVGRIEMAVYRVDLTRDLGFGSDDQTHQWMQRIRLAPSQRVTAWSKDTKDDGTHKQSSERLHLDKKLPLGAYVLEAVAGAERSRDLILVTDATLVMKTGRRNGVAFFCDAVTGAPIAGATVRIWSRDDNNSAWSESTATTGSDGLAKVSISDGTNRGSHQTFAAASWKGRQAFVIHQSYSYWQEPDAWRIYAFTDRAAFRPGEEVQWKIVARRYDGGVWSTPANQTIEYEITDPRGTSAHKAVSRLNQFGSAWATLPLTDAMPLGEYRVTFWDEGRRNQIGYATLFRLEEYKLPEFRVTVKTPEDDGKKKTFKLGDTVDVDIEAEYYFGGPVANATVEVMIYQNPFHHYWFPHRDFHWYYSDEARMRHSWHGGGQVVKRETVRTDAAGRARVRFSTPRGSSNDFEYRVEARVVDASRREITGSGSVRVTRQSYYVHATPRHNLHRPGEKVTIDFKTLNANGEPVRADGTVRITRDRWIEVWIDPSGKEVKGSELLALRDGTGPFPPVPGWRLKFRGYEHDDVLTRKVATDEKGEAELTFTPDREGFYRVAWTSTDGRSLTPIVAETVVWVATQTTNFLGYHHGGVEILLDKDTVKAGQTVPVMLTAPVSDRYVLLSVEAEDLYEWRVVHVTGTVKLVELEIKEQYVPNVFLRAAMVSDGNLLHDQKEIVVPPVKHFLDVSVTSDRSQLQPREKGTFTIRTLDDQGRPVAAEVALGLVDDSVSYIQQEYATDPREFFFGAKRQLLTQMSSTFQFKQYARRDRESSDRFRDELGKKEKDGQDYRADEESGVVGAAVGGVMAESAPMETKMAARNQAAPPPPSSVAPTDNSAVQVRSDFRSTAFWKPDVVTDSTGTAVVTVTYPDSLTTWSATARAASAGSQFGMAKTSTRTKLPLLVRLQAPRFFVVGDEVTISAVINNNTETPVSVAPSLSAEGLTIKTAPETGGVEVGANGERRVEWIVTVPKAGLAKLKVVAKSAAHSDAMEKIYPIYEHGIEKFVSRSGKVRSGEAIVTLELPAARRKESTHVSIQVTPSIAVTMLDALPYLIQYPYGCTEQTMSRFLPAAITAKALKDLGLNPAQIEEKMFGGIEQEFAGRTHSKDPNELRLLPQVTREGLARLYDLQQSDGGWGWWKQGESDHFMTGYVVWGLAIAHQGGIDVRSDVLQRGVDFLEKEIVEEELDVDDQAWMLHALTASTSGKDSSAARRALDNLWEKRSKLNAYGRALVALSAHHLGHTERAQILIRNLVNGVQRDAAPDQSVVAGVTSRTSNATMETAHWGEDGIHWRWSEGGVEATAFGLRALMAIDPKHELVDPVMNWLVKNRRGAQWSDTRETAIAVLALSDYLMASGELGGDATYEVEMNRKLVARKTVTRKDILSAPSSFVVDRNLLVDGQNEVRIRRTAGSSPIYFAAQATYFSLEEPITPAGNEIFVRRDYYKLVGRRTLLKGYVYDKVRLRDGESVKSGERVEVVVTVEAKNNYEYLVFEDLKPAGLEAVAIRSGEPMVIQELREDAIARESRGGAFEPARKRAGSVRIVPPTQPSEPQRFTGRSRWVHQELRDRKVAMFVDKLAQGVWEIRYDLRAEVPGKFHALPLVAHAMYVPEIRANGEEVRIQVVDGE